MKLSTENCPAPYARRTMSEASRLALEPAIVGSDHSIAAAIEVRLPLDDMIGIGPDGNLRKTQAVACELGI